MVTGRYAAFSGNMKMVAILHRELERKVEKVKHMRLEVMRSKTKTNENFHVNCLGRMEGRERGEGGERAGLIERGTYYLSSSENGGGGGLLETGA